MASPNAPVDSTVIENYKMHVSARYLDLTRRKLELTRMPRQVPLVDSEEWALGTPKTALEPLIDFWTESYDWRSQESQLNAQLQQFRTVIKHPPVVARDPDADTDIEAAAAELTKSELLRTHFVHHRSSSVNAMPLLYLHTWPGSFLEVARCIEALVTPVETPTLSGKDPVAFHVVAPSLPGFGFSDASERKEFGARDTATMLVTLMDRLGYRRFAVWGDGWGFKIARMLSMYHPEQIAAVYTSYAVDLPAPQVLKNKDAWLKYQIAKLTGARYSWLSFGYTITDFGAADLKIADPKSKEAISTGAEAGDVEMAEVNAQEDAEQIPPASPRATTLPTTAVARRPQTLSYGLCDSPSGLLALLLDALKPSIPPPGPTPTQTLSSFSPPQTTPRRRSGTIIQHSPTPPLEQKARPVFTATEMLNWTMMYWLPGPEASLRWLLAVEKEDCYASYSHVPLGISWLANSASRASSPSHRPSSSSTPSTSGYTSATTPSADERRRSASPVWASAVQNLKWVKRRSETIEHAVPAWERSDEVVTDVREFFEQAREDGWLGL